MRRRSGGAVISRGGGGNSVSVDLGSLKLLKKFLKN